MAYEKMSFSRAALVGIPAAPDGKRAYYADTKEPGLLLCVTSAGTKSFQVYLKQGGRPVRVTLGRFHPTMADSVELPRDCRHSDFLANTPELNVRMARALAGLVKIDLKSGHRPAEVKRAKRSEMTLGELFEKYETDHLKPNGKKRIKDMREMFERFLGELPDAPRKSRGRVRSKASGAVNWQRRQLSSISKGDVQKLMADLGRESSKHAANQVLALLRAMFNKAIEWQIYTKENPASGVKKYKFDSRERFLQSDELPRFFAAVAAEPNDDIRDSVLISLLTGARKGNVMAMRWADVSLERAEWRIPDTKNGSPVTLPLVPEALEILRRRKPTKAAKFVFPGRGTTEHLRDTKAGWKRILDRDELNQLTDRIRAAGLPFDWPSVRVKGQRDKGRKLETLTESLARARSVAEKHEIDTTGARLADLRIHDLRRTLGSWQAATGASLVVIGKSLGHKHLGSTQIYSRLNIDPVRDSVQTATRAIFAAGGLLQKAEVVPFKKNVA